MSGIEECNGNSKFLLIRLEANTASYISINAIEKIAASKYENKKPGPILGINIVLENAYPIADVAKQPNKSINNVHNIADVVFNQI